MLTCGIHGSESNLLTRHVSVLFVSSVPTYSSKLLRGSEGQRASVLWTLDDFQPIEDVKSERQW